MPANLPGWLAVVILAAVQGLTEFLPVSSSAHLVLSGALLGLREPGIALELTLHLGTLLAVLLYYGRDLGQIVAGVARWTAGRRGSSERSAANMLVLLVIGTVPAVIGALTFGDAVERAFEDPRLACVCLCLTGLLLLSTMRVRRGSRPVWKSDAFVIGLFQMAALFPGISRSGSTIAAGFFRGVRPEEAARFSFLLSIPAILGAVVFKAKALASGWSGGSAGLYALGFVVSFVLGYASIAWLLQIVRRGRFGWFGVYCLVVGVLGIILLGMR